NEGAQQAMRRCELQPHHTERSRQVSGLEELLQPLLRQVLDRQTCALQKGNGSSKGGSCCDTRHDAPLARAALATLRRPVGDSGAATESQLPTPLQQFSVR